MDKIKILLYVDDISLLFESKHDLQSHLNTLDDFCTHRGLIVNLRKTKVLIFHISAQVWTKVHLTLSHRPVNIVRSVERANSTWVGPAEEAKNRIGLDRSVRPGSVEEAGSQIGWRRIDMSRKAVGKIFPRGNIFWS